MDMMQKINEAKAYIRTKSTMSPKIGLVLGSGLGSLVEEMTEAVHIPFENIPHFAIPTVEGHSGKVVIGKLNGVDVVALSGRYHYYEGYDLSTVTFPIRVMKMLGVEKIILTNACGAVNTQFKPGDLMIITDHLNLTERSHIKQQANLKSSCKKVFTPGGLVQVMKHLLKSK